jgi:hypothetical protein
MLCYSLRRLFRLRNEQSFRSIEEASEMFAGAWCDYVSQGPEKFMAEVSAKDLSKQA